MSTIGDFLSSKKYLKSYQQFQVRDKMIPLILLKKLKKGEPFLAQWQKLKHLINSPRGKNSIKVPGLYCFKSALFFSFINAI